MKRVLLFLVFLSLAGCTYEGRTLEDFVEDPGAIVKDPHFADYQQKRDDLEHQFLHKKITFAEYTQKMEDLDIQYQKEVQERNEIISGN